MRQHHVQVTLIYGNIRRLTHGATRVVQVRRQVRQLHDVLEVGEGGIQLLVGNGLLKQHQVGDRHAVGAACLAGG